MTVVDLQNKVTDSHVKLIEINETTVYYAEEKAEEGLYSLFLLEYDRITETERMIANCILGDPSVVLHFFSFPNDIIVIMENGDSSARLLRFDKQTGEEKNSEKLRFIGSFSGCMALDESRVIFYTEENESHKHLFEEYKKASGFERIAYLYDIQEERYYYVRDKRICNLSAEKLIPFDAAGERMLLILEPYGSEEEKEKCFRNRRWLGDEINDNVWLCPLLDFVVSVKADETHLPLELLLNAGTQGLVRYVGQDEHSLYFRAKYYPNSDQRICMVEKVGGKKTVVAELNLKDGEEPAGFFIEPSPTRIYRVTELEDTYEIQGVLNSEVSSQYSKELGQFVACVEDRFLVAEYIISDETDSYVFYSIYDLETKQQQSFECGCAVQDDTIVLY